MEFFDKSPSPPVPISEYAFFLFMPESAPARCFTFHRIANPLLFLSKTFGVYKWNNSRPGFRTGESRLKFDPKEKRFQARGDANIDFKQSNTHYRVQGDAFEEKFDVVVNLGDFREKKSWHPKAAVRLHNNGFVFDLNLNDLGTLTAGRLHSIFAPYSDRISGERGRCYIERLHMASIEPTMIFWHLFDVFFEDGSFFTHWEIPTYDMARGLYIHHPTGEIRVLPRAKTTIGPDWRAVECTDGENTIKAVAKGLWPVHAIPFNFGLMRADYHQIVGQLAEFKVNGQSIEQGGIVYVDEVPSRIGFEL